MTTKQMTDEEIAQSSELRYRNAFGWLTTDETRVIQHALKYYIAQPNSSWPIQLARDLLEGSKK
jgi:hypothetical protein